MIGYNVEVIASDVEHSTSRGDRSDTTGNVRRMTIIRFAIFILFLLYTLRPAGAEKFGALRLCPPGGRSFMVAWNLACEMKKKKRGSPNKNDSQPILTKRVNPPDGYRAATLSDIMNICCDMGCDIRDLLAYCDPFGSWNS